MNNTPCRALLIGINYTASTSALQGCHQDVDHIEHYLQLMYGKQWLQTRRLIDDSEKGSIWPTYSSIMDGLRWLADWKDNQCDLWLVYSGHGGQVPDANGDERKDHLDECIFPVDALYKADAIITDDTLRTFVNTLSSKVRLFVLGDMCHSGTAFDLAYTGGRIRYDKRTAPTECAVCCITGCRDDQTSADTVRGGVMTCAFLDALKETPLTCTQLSAEEVVEKMNERIHKIGYEQVVQVSFGRKDDQFQFPTTPARSWWNRTRAWICVSVQSAKMWVGY